MTKTQFAQEHKQLCCGKQASVANRRRSSTYRATVQPQGVEQNWMGNAALQRLLAQRTGGDLFALDIASVGNVRLCTGSAQRQPEAANPTAQSQSEAQRQWIAHPTIHHYFGHRYENYDALLSQYQARGIVNPAHYIQANIVNVRFFGRSTPAHRDMLAPLATAENSLREQNITPDISRIWSFKPRLSSNGNLSQHAAGRAVDINAPENPHIRHPVDIEVVAALTRVDLGQRQDAEDMRQASTTFQRDFTQDWIDQQSKDMQRKIRQRRSALDDYAQHGFLNLEQSLIDALIDGGFTWGGAWNRSKDFMHFELGW